MSISLPPPANTEIYYPESDGLPMSDNTRQFRWIFVLFGNLAAWYYDDPKVFVSGNQLWFPVEGEPETSVSPDVYVVFGRPKGDRSSYKQWEEGGVPMTVVFEVLSPSNTAAEMENKFDFYEEYGVEEYYVYDPDKNRLKAYIRQGEILVPGESVKKFVSPRLGIRFELTSPEMTVFLPNGRPFKSFELLERERLQAEQRADRAEQRAARLIELGRKARRGLATPEELAELDRLENIS